MKNCSKCKKGVTKVLESRDFEEHSLCIRRRRECKKCGERMTTYEYDTKFLDEVFAKAQSFDRLSLQLSKIMEANR